MLRWLTPGALSCRLTAAMRKTTEMPASKPLPIFNNAVGGWCLFRDAVRAITGAHVHGSKNSIFAEWGVDGGGCERGWQSRRQSRQQGLFAR
jgi:hypothetical protein